VIHLHQGHHPLLPPQVDLDLMGNLLGGSNDPLDVVISLREQLLASGKLTFLGVEMHELRKWEQREQKRRRSDPQGRPPVSLGLPRIPKCY
jgi:hypothetical protein